MRIGTSNVLVTAAGFKTAQLTGIVVEVATVAALDVKLETGMMTETVGVSAGRSPCRIRKLRYRSRHRLSRDLGLPLPLGSAVQFTRSPASFIFTLPGTTGPGTAGVNSPTTGSNGGTFESKLSGGQAYGAEVLLDGMGRIEFQRKQYQNTADLLQRAVTADSSLRQAHYYLGLTYARLGEKENSEKELQTASQIERDDLDKSKYVLKLLNPEEAPPGTEKKE
jgi:hypothetical protein